MSIRGDADDPLSRGYICPKAHALKDMWEDPDRLQRPMVREGDSWREVSWPEAIATAARGIHEVQRRGGKDAMASYIGNPTAHNTPAMTALPPFLRLLGSRNRYSASTVDQYPKMLACYLLYGGQLSIPVPDVDRTDYFLILGANPMASNGSLMTAPGMRARLRAIKERGGRIVVVDPRRSETARVATEHVFIRPGTDSLLLAAMLHTIFDEALVQPGAAEGRVDGVERLAELCAAFPPDAVADATGISAADIRRITREFVSTERAACYLRIGTSVQEFGTLASFLGEAVNIVAGKLDRPGGMLWPKAAVDVTSPGTYRRWESRIRGLREFGGELPVACLAEEIETPGQGQVRGLVTCAGNPVLSTPNGTRLEKALESLEFMVSVDPALNETTRLADVILPPRHSLQNSQYALVFHKLAVRDTAKYSDPVFPPDSEQWSEWEILAALSAELVRLRNEDLVAAGQEPVPDPTAMHYGADPAMFLSMALGAGPYGLDLDTLRANPSGVDLGELKPDGLGRAVLHEGGRVALVNEDIEAELARLREQWSAGQWATGPEHSNGFLLIGRRQLRSNNSWMHNCPSLMKGPERCTLLMHPEDSTRLGLKEGATVRVTSRVGEVELPLAVSDEVMPGVVSMPHGFGHDRPGVRARVATASPGASMNDVTDETVVEGLVGNAVLTGVPVRVAAREPASV